MKLATTAQMREMDRAALEDYSIPGLVLMENAALRVVDDMAVRFAPLAGKRIAVICGKGNNGGDGLAIARHLHAHFGADVTAWLAADPTSLSSDAQLNYTRAQQIGVSIRPARDRGDMLRQSDIIVDALLGTGIRGGVSGELAQVIDGINACRCPVVAVDVPSGLDADTGQVTGACVKATVTITLGLAKFGLLDYPGASFVGELVVADIGLPPLLMAAKGDADATEAADIARWLPARAEGRDINKGTFGTAVVFAGSRGMIGASVLCAEAAARTGAGLVTLAMPHDSQAAVMSRVNPVVMTRGLPETEAGTFAESALGDALALAQKATAAAIGPGLGGASHAGTQDFVREFIRQCPVPLVVDADALNILSRESDRGTSLVQSRAAATILTPHPGEMGRLLGRDTTAVQDRRREAAEQAAAGYGCIVLLKGARTLIAAPGGTLRINVTGNAGMASGGMGDTLTGIIAALLAGGLPAPEAAAAGAYLHGLAGDMAAAAWGGKTGMLATDIIEMLPRAIARCQEKCTPCRA